MKDKRIYTVYIHTCNENGKKYVGITSKQPEQRWKNGNGYQSQNFFWNAIKKYGWDNFNSEIILSELTETEAYHKEIELISFYKSNNSNFGYNLSSGGESPRIGCKHNKEAKQKISSANNRKRRGHSEETKQKMSISHMGKVLSEETKRKLSVIKKGKVASEETRQRMSASFKGRKYSKETRAKMSEASNSRKRAVRNITTGKIFKSTRDAANFYNIHQSNIVKVCCKQRNTTGGYQWEYVD